MNPSYFFFNKAGKWQVSLVSNEKALFSTVDLSEELKWGKPLLYL